MTTYLIIGIIVGFILMNDYPIRWFWSSRAEIICEIMLTVLLWPIFIAGIVYGFIKGRRK